MQVDSEEVLTFEHTGPFNTMSLPMAPITAQAMRAALKHIEECDGKNDPIGPRHFAALMTASVCAAIEGAFIQLLYREEEMKVRMAELEAKVALLGAEQV